MDKKTRTNFENGLDFLSENDAGSIPRNSIFLQNLRIGVKPFVETQIFLQMILFAWSFCFTSLSWLDSNIYKWSFRKS